MRPIDLPTRETLRFVSSQISVAGARVLEVGCGAGELALQLQNLGHRVVALDSSPEAIDLAKELGVDARVARWPEFDEEPFDVVVFTRSLHHIHPLTEAVAQAHKLLNPAGLVVVEDFAYEEVRRSTVDWSYGVLSLLESCGKLSLEDDSLSRALLASEGNLETWRDYHDPNLNTASSVLLALKHCFEPLVESSAPYVYRYICAVLKPGDDSDAVASRVLEMERRLGTNGAIDLIGRRFVGRR